MTNLVIFLRAPRAGVGAPRPSPAREWPALAVRLPLLAATPVLALADLVAVSQRRRVADRCSPRKKRAPRRGKRRPGAYPKAMAGAIYFGPAAQSGKSAVVSAMPTRGSSSEQPRTQRARANKAGLLASGRRRREGSKGGDTTGHLLGASVYGTRRRPGGEGSLGVKRRRTSVSRRRILGAGTSLTNHAALPGFPTRTRVSRPPIAIVSRRATSACSAEKQRRRRLAAGIGLRLWEPSTLRGARFCSECGAPAPALCPACDRSSRPARPSAPTAASPPG